MTPLILVPYDKRESITLARAAEIAGRSPGTVKSWCLQRDIGRRVAGGPWCVSRVCLAMLLDGNAPALAAYHAGDRHGPMVAPYFQRLGLGALLTLWAATGPQKATELTKTANPTIST